MAQEWQMSDDYESTDRFVRRLGVVIVCAVLCWPPFFVLLLADVAPAGSLHAKASNFYGSNGKLFFVVAGLTFLIYLIWNPTRPPMWHGLAVLPVAAPGLSLAAGSVAPWRGQ